MMQVKGSAIASMPRFIEEKHSPAGLGRWLDSLSPEAKQIYGGKVLANSWYPLKTALQEPTAKMCELFYGGNARGATEIGRYSADVGLNGVYKVFMKAGSPEFIFKRASSVLSSYYTPSEIKVAGAGGNSVAVHITQFPESSPLIEARIGGWMQRALEIHGCKNVAIKVNKSIARGDSYTEYALTWN